MSTVPLTDEEARAFDFRATAPDPTSRDWHAPFGADGSWCADCMDEQPCEVNRARALAVLLEQRIAQALTLHREEWLTGHNFGPFCICSCGAPVYPCATRQALDPEGSER